MTLFDKGRKSGGNQNFFSLGLMFCCTIDKQSMKSGSVDQCECRAIVLICNSLKHKFIKYDIVCIRKSVFYVNETNFAWLRPLYKVTSM